MKKYKPRNKSYVCIATGYTMKSNTPNPDPNACCPERVVGFGVANEMPEAAQIEKKSANDSIPLGCKAKHLGVACFRV